MLTLIARPSCRSLTAVIVTLACRSRGNQPTPGPVAITAVHVLAIPAAVIHSPADIEHPGRLLELPLVLVLQPLGGSQYPGTPAGQLVDHHSHQGLPRSCRRGHGLVALGLIYRLLDRLQLYRPEDLELVQAEV